ncbi:MAG: beta-hydroxyacyl-ACP dehydratase [Pirellulales bacterium]|nr:beta-hydroxyacyl-ACP dehydratase [Pirellulales bacterium]
MRWRWIDRYVEFHCGSRAKALKNVSLAESHLRDHFNSRPLMPNTLILEGMGQTGMYLAFEATEYTDLILLAKVASARFYREAVPGDLLTYSVSIDWIRERGVSVTARSHVGERLQGEAEIIYARRAGHENDLRELTEQMHLLGVFDIGVSADGGPLQPPAMPGAAAGLFGSA